MWWFWIVLAYLLGIGSVLLWAGWDELRGR